MTILEGAKAKMKHADERAVTLHAHLEMLLRSAVTPCENSGAVLTQELKQVVNAYYEAGFHGAAWLLAKNINERLDPARHSSERQQEPDGTNSE